MTDAATVPLADPKAEKKAKVKKPDPIAAARGVLASEAPEVTVGDIVLYAPPRAAVDSLRANRGYVVSVWAAIVTHVFEDGAISLTVFRPFGLGNDPRQRVAYSADGAPDTWRPKD